MTLNIIYVQLCTLMGSVKWQTTEPWGHVKEFGVYNQFISFNVSE